MNAHVIDFPDTPTIDVSRGSFFGPCAGMRDLALPLKAFGDRIDHFVFADLAYLRHRGLSAAPFVPSDWVRVHAHSGVDATQGEKVSHYLGSRPFRPTLTEEVWRRPDGSEVRIEFWGDQAQDVLLRRFALGSLSVFLHHHDGTGEGGSDLWFLADGDPEARHRPGFLVELAARLTNKAAVLTDRMLTDDWFRFRRPFHRHGLDWKKAGVFLPAAGGLNETVIWLATRKLSSTSEAGRA